MQNDINQLFLSFSFSAGLQMSCIRYEGSSLKNEDSAATCTSRETVPFVRKMEKTSLFHAGVQIRYIQNRTAFYSREEKFTNLRVKCAKPYITAFCIGVFHIRGTGEMLAIFIETVLCSGSPPPLPKKKE